MSRLPGPPSREAARLPRGVAGRGPGELPTGPEVGPSRGSQNRVQFRLPNHHSRRARVPGPPGAGSRRVAAVRPRPDGPRFRGRGGSPRRGTHRRDRRVPFRTPSARHPGERGSHPCPLRGPSRSEETRSQRRLVLTIEIQTDRKIYPIPKGGTKQGIPRPQHLFSVPRPPQEILIDGPARIEYGFSQPARSIAILAGEAAHVAREALLLRLDEHDLATTSPARLRALLFDAPLDVFEPRLLLRAFHKADVTPIAEPLGIAR